MDHLGFKITPDCPDCAFCRKEPPKLVYQVQYGYALEEHEAFATFDEALLFYRGYLKCQGRRTWNGDPSTDDGPSLVNIDNIDGTEDAGVAAQHGLTTEQWERVEAVG